MADFFKVCVDKKYMVEALDAIRAGADPNQSLDRLCPDYSPRLKDYTTPSEKSWSVLHLMVSHGEPDMVQELLAKGACVQVRFNQPSNLIAVAIDMLDKFVDPNPHVDAVIAIINMLIAHGARCDPKAISQERRAIRNRKIPQYYVDPFWALMRVGELRDSGQRPGTPMTSGNFWRLANILIEQNASPDAILAKLTQANQPPDLEFSPHPRPAVPDSHARVVGRNARLISFL